MTSDPVDFEALVGAISIRREGMPVVEGGHLTIRFGMSGPGAVIRTAKDHVAVFDVGAGTRLESLGGYGMQDAPGGPFFVWELTEPHGDTVEVFYTDGGEVIASEVVSVVRGGSPVRPDDDATLTFQVPGGTSDPGPGIVPVDERDSSWEDGHPRFRVYLHGSGDTETYGWTDTYDITGADVLQVIDWAQRQAGDVLTYAVALVRDDVEHARINPGRGRGLVWLVGMDGNDTTDPGSADDVTQQRMLARRHHRIDVADLDTMPTTVHEPYEGGRPTGGGR